MWSWWNSSDKVHYVSWAARLLTVILGAVAFFVGNRESSLNKKDREREQSNTKERVAKTEAKAAEANKLAQESHTKGIDLEQQNIVLSTSLAKVQMEAANAQRSLLEVRDRIKARHFTEEQEATLLSLLKGAPTGSIRVHYAEQDGEARAFADQIVGVMKKARWYVEGHEPIQQNRRPDKTEDLVFDVPLNSPPPASLQPLRDALAKVGFSSGTRDLGSADGVVDLFVGSKRPRD